MTKLKINCYTFWGGSSAIFIFASLFKGGPLLTKRICSWRRKFFLLSVDLLRMGVIIQHGKQKVASVLSQSEDVHTDLKRSLSNSVIRTSTLQKHTKLSSSRFRLLWRNQCWWKHDIDWSHWNILVLMTKRMQYNTTISCLCGQSTLKVSKWK